MSSFARMRRDTSSLHSGQGASKVCSSLRPQWQRMANGRAVALGWLNDGNLLVSNTSLGGCVERVQLC